MIGGPVLGGFAPGHYFLEGSEPDAPVTPTVTADERPLHLAHVFFNTAPEDLRRRKKRLEEERRRAEELRREEDAATIRMLLESL